MVALAVLVNTGNPSIIKYSPSQIKIAEAKTVVVVGGDKLETKKLWNGNELNTATDMSLASEAATSSSVSPLASSISTAPKKKIVARLTMSSSVVKSVVENYFADIPIMIRIAECESQFRQYNASTGEVLRGRVNSADRGVMQINEMYHGNTARKLGINLLTIDGNMAYARHLYNEQGTRPWISSSPCWGSSVTDELAKS